MTDLQSMGYPSALLFESRTNMVKFTSLSRPILCSRMDGIRTPHHPLGRFPAYTAIIPFFVDTEYHTDRWIAGSLECGLLDRGYPRSCFRVVESGFDWTS